MELKQYLKTNCHWENRVIISPNELMAIYSKANYQPTPKLIDFLIYFYNQEFQFPKVDVHFNLKKTLNDNPHYLFYDQFCELHIPADTRSAFPVISVQSPVSIQCCWQS